MLVQFKVITCQYKGHLNPPKASTWGRRAMFSQWKNLYNEHWNRLNVNVRIWITCIAHESGYSCAVEVWEWISKFILHFIIEAIPYACLVYSH